MGGERELLLEYNSGALDESAIRSANSAKVKAEALVVGTQLRGRFGGGEQPKSSAKADVGDPRGTTATWLLSIGL